VLSRPGKTRESRTWGMEQPRYLGSPRALVIPCLNEAETIGEVVRAARTVLDPERDVVVVVDNGSTDGTAGVAAHAGAEVVTEPRPGYGRACRAGLRVASGIALFMDGDRADDPADLQRVLEPILAGTADLVVGARSVRERGSMPLAQRAGNRVVCALVSMLCLSRVSDLGPMRAIPADLLRDLDMRAETYGWSTEMTVKAIRAGYRYREVPVGHRRRGGGRSKVSGTISGAVRAGGSLVWTALRWARWRPAPGVA
jgi:glycosyltransferase involved in cell wall biosynthesis